MEEDLNSYCSSWTEATNIPKQTIHSSGLTHMGYQQPEAVDDNPAVRSRPATRTSASPSVNEGPEGRCFHPKSFLLWGSRRQRRPPRSIPSLRSPLKEAGLGGAPGVGGAWADVSGPDGLEPRQLNDWPARGSDSLGGGWRRPEPREGCLSGPAARRPIARCLSHPLSRPHRTAELRPFLYPPRPQPLLVRPQRPAPTALVVTYLQPRASPSGRSEGGDLGRPPPRLAVVQSPPGLEPTHSLIGPSCDTPSTCGRRPGEVTSWTSGSVELGRAKGKAAGTGAGGRRSREWRRAGSPAIRRGERQAEGAASPSGATAVEQGGDPGPLPTPPPVLGSGVSRLQT